MRKEDGLDTRNQRVRLPWLSEKAKGLRLWANRNGIKLSKARSSGPRRKSFITTLAYKKLKHFESEYIGIFSEEWFDVIAHVHAINEEDDLAERLYLCLENLFDGPEQPERVGPPL